jgi:hypothetical protein
VPVIFISIELIHHRWHHVFQNKERRFYKLCMCSIDNNMKIHKNSRSRKQIWQVRQCTYNAKLWHIQIFASRFFPFIWQRNVLKIHNKLLDTLLLSSSTVTTIKGTDGMLHVLPWEGHRVFPLVLCHYVCHCQQYNTPVCVS